MPEPLVSLPAGNVEPGGNQLHSVQVMRAIAATLVVWAHAEALLHRVAHTAELPPESGAFGVDIFFVISGCVMTVTSQNAFGRPGARASFLRRRIARIYPPYWVYAAVTALLVVAAGGRPGAVYLLESFLLLPVLNEAGKLRPILGVGWTLTYELYFYAAFALALGATRGRAVLSLGALLGGVGVLAPLLVGRHGAWGIFLSDLIVVEFFAGALIGLCLESLVRLPRWAGPLAAGVGGAAWLVAPVPDERYRWLCWGVPATLLVLGALSAEKSGLWRRSPHWLVKLGDSSYSLYLLHPVLFIVLGAVGKRTGWLGGVPIEAGVLVAIASSVGLSYPAYRYLELPLISRTRRWLTPRRTAPALSPAVPTPPR